MKKISILVLAAVLVFGMAACGSGTSSESGAGSGSSTAEVPNPLAQISLKQFESDTGFQVDLYEGYELGDCYKINTDPVIYGVGITDEDGVEYDVRLAKTSNLVEISGMNYQWTYTNDPEPKEEVQTEEEAADEAEAAAETAAAEEPAKDASEEDAEEEVPDYYFYFNDEGQGMITWYEDAYSWSVSATKGATKEGMDRMYEDLYGMISF